MPEANRRDLLVLTFCCALLISVADHANAQPIEPALTERNPIELPALDVGALGLPFDPVLSQPMEKREVDDPAIRTAGASIGEVGQRLTKEEVAGSPTPYARLNSRLDTRIQSRIQNRLDQNYETVEENAEDQRRRLAPRR